ncbi:radical SAM protein [Azospirillum sp. A26]|uniref:radical SAM protein n=1 Tax=Azospirillum sp. A26 TaxID=3160607 RepID=UPI003672A164
MLAHPPTGCRHCIDGAKAQIHLTFRCNLSCGFCPVPAEKFGRDVMELAGTEIDPSSMERLVDDVAGRSELRGVAISGGEALLFPQRLLALVGALRAARGPGFHIHLYTNGVASSRTLLEEAVAAGVNEFRVNNQSPRIFAKFAGLAVEAICEVPCLPGTEFSERMRRLIEAMPGMGLHRVNLNEVEVTRENRDWLEKRGFSLAGHRIAGCAEAAASLARHGGYHNVSVFYCDHETADRIRIARNRLTNEAKPCHRPIGG